ncbi:AAA family ATPase [Microvirga zambiensis]|uniref:AAA family ATPase n=1 Tax=Microvirga zambiensis TaxID=1402137 RepID=UPI00191D1F15|nr:AAA family ATPase [Microvirga zambiensis]
MTDRNSAQANDLPRAWSANAAEARLSHQVPVIEPSVRPREGIRIPKIAIDVFWDSPQVAASLDRMAVDRVMSGARVNLRQGGIAAAIDHYEQAPTPNLVVVESRSSASAFLVELDRLAEVCDAGTKVLAIGHINDIVFYRGLLERGVSDYMLAPVDPVAVIEGISRIYGDGNAEKLGQVYAFIGAKGGSGSSTIAHNVAWTIARRFSSGVVLADMDLPFGTASLDFNVDQGQGVAEAIKDIGRLDSVLFDRLLMKCRDNLSLLSAPAELNSHYDLEERTVERLLEVAQSSVPFVILDMPHLWTKWSRNTLVSADEIVITATPDLASLRNARNLVDILRQARPHDPPPKLVLNQVGVPKRPEIKPDDFAKALQLQPLAVIPFEASQFGTAANKGQMIADVSTKGQASKAIGLIAEALTGRQEQKSSPRKLFGLGSLLTGLRRKSGGGSAKKAT